MACDICLKSVNDLTPLLSVYQTSAIKVICPSCVKAVDKELWRLRENNARDLIAFMESKRGKLRFWMFTEIVSALFAKVDEHDAVIDATYPKE